MKKTITFVLILLLFTSCAQLGQDNDTSNGLSDDLNESFFFPEAMSSAIYQGYISFDEDYLAVSPVQLRIIHKENIENLYELVLDKIEGVPDDRLALGYFYVDGKTIYRLKTPTEENNVITQEDILLIGDIVCNDKPIIGNLTDEEKGSHHSVDTYDNKCESSFFNNQVETGFYETFVWELGKGLIEYKSGFGAERDSIHLIAE